MSIPQRQRLSIYPAHSSALLRPRRDMLTIAYPCPTPTTIRWKRPRTSKSTSISPDWARFCAILVDYLLMGAVVIALLILALALEIGMPVQMRGRADMWILAFILSIVLALMTGYFLLFEWLMRGQTPGKKVLKIRVIRDDGTPVTIREVFVRNVVRLVDFLPGFYAVGVLFMFPSRLSKRLGDIAAGTIVIKEEQLNYSAAADRKRVLHMEPLEHINGELTPAERRLISGFLQRRAELLPQAREVLAERLAFPLYEKYRGEYMNAEDYLVRLAEGKQHET